MQAANPYRTPVADVADVASTEFGQVNILSVKGRLGRVRYIGYSIGLVMLCNIGGGVLSRLAGPTVGVFIYFAAMIAVLVLTTMLTVQRAHDFNVTGWLAIVAFIPLVNFIFWLIPGTDGENRYGPKTPPNSKLAVILVSVLPALMIIGIIAAVAIPAYQKYQHPDSSGEPAGFEQTRSTE